MNIAKEVDILPISKNNISDVIDILQSVSKYKPSYSSVLETWNNFSNQSNYHGLVAIHNGTVVGYGSIFFVIKIRGGKMGQIDEIATHKDFRMKGIGKLILSNLYDLAVKERCYKIALTCKEFNIQFYQNQNFILDGFHLNKIL